MIFFNHLNKKIVLKAVKIKIKTYNIRNLFPGKKFTHFK